MLITACIVTNTYTHLIAALMSLINQTHPPYKIIIGFHTSREELSDHENHEVLDCLLNYFPHIQCIDVSDISFSQARYRVASEARTEWILTFDGDQCAAPRYVETLKFTAEHHDDVVAVTGKLINIDRETDNRYNAIYQMPPTRSSSGVTFVPFINSGLQLVRRDVYLYAIQELPDILWLNKEQSLGGNDIFMSSLYYRFGNSVINYDAYCYHLRLSNERVMDDGKKELALEDDWIPKALYNIMSKTDFNQWAKVVRVVYENKYQTLFDILLHYPWFKAVILDTNTDTDT